MPYTEVWPSRAWASKGLLHPVNAIVAAKQKRLARNLLAFCLFPPAEGLPNVEKSLQWQAMAPDRSTHSAAG